MNSKITNFMLVEKLKKVMLNGGGLLHLETSALIVIAIGKISFSAALVAAVIAGLGKEAYDKKEGGKFDWKDLACDAVGIAFGSLLVLV